MPSTRSFKQLVRPEQLPRRPHLTALNVAHGDRRTIAQPALEPAIPTVAGSDARERQRRALPPFSRRQHTGHWRQYKPTPSQPRP
jgi:hypothetical protein